MKIGMILDKPFPPDPRVQNEAETLLKNGFEVFLFCLKYGNEPNTENIDGIEVRRYKSDQWIYKSSALAYTVPLYSLFMKPKIEMFIKENSIDVLHVHDMVIAESVFKANQNFNLPFVLDLHENRPEIMKEYPHLKKFPNRYLISIQKWKEKESEMMRRASKVILVTQEAKKYFVERDNISPEKLSVVPNTVRPQFYAHFNIDQQIIDRYQNKFSLLYIGDTGLRRGLMTAIDAIPELSEKIPSLKLVIVGKSSEDAVLKEKVRRLRIQNYVDFEGWQNPEKFQSYIISSSVCLSPLLSNIHHDTTYANKIFQYMSLGKPLLVSDVRAQKNIVEKANCGLIHLANNSKDFIKKALILYEDDNQRNQLGKNGNRFIQHQFNWEITSKELVNLYRELEKNQS